MGNPFTSTTVLNTALETELCQKIHYTALRKATSTQVAREVPASVSLQELVRRARRHGPNTYLLHPAYIEHIFKGITLAVYQEIAALYVSRVGRSVAMVQQVLNTMAEEAGSPQVDNEAVWAICRFLEDQRTIETELLIERMSHQWLITHITPPLQVQDGQVDPYQPLIACVVDLAACTILAARIGPQAELHNLYSLALYDALIAQRLPDQTSSVGLRWTIPSTILLDGVEHDPIGRVASLLSIQAESVDGATLRTIHEKEPFLGSWAHDFCSRVYQRQQFSLLFDSYLYRLHGSSPQRRQRAQSREFRHLVGYNRDPATLFAELRWLLPTYQGRIEGDSTVFYDGLHYTDAYEDDLLRHWQGSAVVLRRSAQSEVLAWVYVGDEIIGPAMARELRRQDGSYRTSRPGRRA